MKCDSVIGFMIEFCERYNSISFNEVRSELQKRKYFGNFLSRKVGCKYDR